MELQIDYREKDIIDIFKMDNNMNMNMNTYTYNVCNLDVGDIHIIKDNKIVCIIERKTVSDYISSIKDGRNSEQSFRLTEYLHKLKDHNIENKIDDNIDNDLYNPIIVYLIEGSNSITMNNNNRYIQPRDMDALFSSLCNKIIRDRFYIYQTIDINQSVKFIKSFYNKFSNLEKLYNEKNKSYANNIKVSKKEHLTPEIYYTLILTQIPSISHNIAESIIKKYPTLLSLIDTYRSISVTEGKHLLSNILINKKRIGDSLSEKIYEYLMYKEEINNKDLNKEINNKEINKPLIKIKFT